MRSLLLALLSPALAVSLAGCSSQIPAPDLPPPAPADVSAVAESEGSAANAAANAIALVVPPVANAPVEWNVWEQSCRFEATRNRLVFRFYQPKPDDPPGRQAELIREAIQQGTTGLLVVPGPGIAQALAEAKGQGIPIVLLDRPLTVEGKPLPCVVTVPVKDSAEVLVSAAIEAAKATGMSPKGPAVIVHHVIGDDRTDERAKVLEETAKAAGIEFLPRLDFTGPTPNATKVFNAYSEAHPQIHIVFADDEIGLSAMGEVRYGRDKDKRFALTGYSDSKQGRQMVQFNQVNLAVDLNLDSIARRALLALKDAMDGKPLPERIEVAYTVLRPSEETKSNPPASFVPKPQSGPSLKESVDKPRVEGKPRAAGP